MTIDLERLAVDADYWDEVAPEGASHLIDDFTFTKWEYGEEFSWDIRHDTAWVADDPIYPLSKYLKECYRWKVLAKPTKPATPKPHPTDTQPAESGAQISVEWDGEGLPPVGCDCKILRHGHCIPAKVIAHGEHLGEVVAFCQTESHAMVGDFRQFRPLRSQAERDREEIISAAVKVIDVRFGSPRSIYVGYCEALYEAGMLRRSDK
jgi:hypothetical protein